MDAWITAAQWIAPAATMIAAMMTAANLGARTTGWGFVVFTLGSLCWALIGASTGQISLLTTNAFLTLVNLAGIWRWMGRQARYQEGAEAAVRDSEQATGSLLAPASALCGLAVTDCHGCDLGHCVEALIDRSDGRIDYIVVASANAVGLDEELRGVKRMTCRFGKDAISLAIDAVDFRALPILPDRAWPARL